MVDINAIRKRVQELNGNYRNSNIQLWKPEAGEYKVRGVPFPSTPDGMPFLERHFYYIGNASILAPKQFGKPDPINDLIRKLYSSGRPDDRAMAKKLGSKMRAYMPIVVRGQEDKGVQIWSFGKIVYQRLLGFFTDEDVGDILDPMQGFDLKVTIAPSSKKVDGRVFMDTTIDAARRPSQLSDNPDLMKKWLDNVPNINDLYREKSEKDIENILNSWLATGNTDDGAARAQEPAKDALDQLVDDVKGSDVAQESAEVVKPRRAKKVDIDEASVPKAKQSLDDAFADLMGDD